MQKNVSQNKDDRVKVTQKVIEWEEREVPFLSQAF